MKDAMQVLRDRMLYDEYTNEVEGIECLGCGLTPHDLEDEFMVNGGWQTFFTMKGVEWFCTGCVI